MNVQSLTLSIQSLKTIASELDGHSRAVSRSVLFDDVLFSSKSPLLGPYLAELELTLSELLKYQNEAELQSPRLTYLSERFINQFGAIQRAVNIQEAEKSTPKPLGSIQQLYQDREQHRVWEQRLQRMVRDQVEQLESNSTNRDHAKQQQAILTLEQRLHRCQVAKQKIENAIARQERMLAR
jgi:primosomal replication protein N''